MSRRQSYIRKNNEAKCATVTQLSAQALLERITVLSNITFSHKRNPLFVFLMYKEHSYSILSEFWRDLQ